MRTRDPGPEWSERVWLAASRAHAGALEEAERTLLETLDDARAEGATPKAELAILGELADCVRKQTGERDGYGDALDLDRARLDLARDAFGERSPELYEVLVDVLSGRRGGPDAERALAENLTIAREALSLSFARYGDDDRRTLPARLMVAACLKDAGQGQDADNVYADAVDVALESCGPARVETAVALHNRAVHLLHALGHVAEAAGCFAASIEARRAAGDARGAWPALLGLAEARRRLGALEEAEDLARVALQMWEQSFARAPTPDEEAVRMLARIVRERGRDDEADALLEAKPVVADA